MMDPLLPASSFPSSSPSSFSSSLSSSSFKPPLNANNNNVKPNLHNFHDINDSLNDLSAFLSATTLKYTTDYNNINTSSHYSSVSSPSLLDEYNEKFLTPFSNTTNNTILPSTSPPNNNMQYTSGINNNNNSINYLETISNRENKQHQNEMLETKDAAFRVITLKEQEITRLNTVCNYLSYLVYYYIILILLLFYYFILFEF